jgi:integral membrane protein (TIGR00529 family)
MTMDMVWVGFLTTIAVLLILARYSLPLALLAGSVVLGLTTLTPEATARAIFDAATDPAYLSLSVAMSLFPVLGAALQQSGMLDDLVTNLSIGRKAFMASSAALIGLLPVPGGALISAPLVKKAGGGHPQDKSFVINIWFRHILILIYPLSPALIVPADIAGISVYEVIPYLVPAFLLFIAVGYWTLLRDVEGDDTAKDGASWKKAVAPLCIILVAPILDYGIKYLGVIEPQEAVTLLAVMVSVAAAIAAGRLRLRPFLKAAARTKPWKFFAIILCMYFFIEVFNRTTVGAAIAALDVPLVVLCVGIGFLLAFVIGRTQLSAAVVFPAYLGAAGVASIGPLAFSITFVSIFLGYLISPLHPCISVSLEFFDTTLGRAIRIMAPQTMGMLALMAALFVLLV